MFLTGYHGTSKASGEDVIRNGEYSFSDGSTEWLGSGIYFYYDFQDAYDWKLNDKDGNRTVDCDVVLHSVVEVDDDEYVDFYTDSGVNIIDDFVVYVKQLLEKADVNNKFELGFGFDVQKNQGMFMKLLSRQLPKCKVFSSYFPREPKQFRIMFDTRYIGNGKLRREFCVRSNDVIKHTYMIEKSDLK